MSIFRLLTAGCVAILAAISGMVPGALAAGDEIVIGAPISLTGIFAADGLEQKWGYEQAIADANARGGVFVKAAGKKLPVRLVVADDESEPGKVAGAMERLIKVDKVDLLLSTHGGPMNVAGAIVAEKYKKFYMMTTCFPFMWSPQNFKWSALFFFTAGSAAEVPFKIWNSLPEDQRPQRPALVSEDTPDGHGFGGAFKSFAKQYGYSFAVDEPWAVGAKDYSAHILKMKAAKVDAILLFGAPADSITLVRQMKEHGLSVKYLHGWKGTWTGEFHDALGKDSDYVIADGFWSADFPYAGSAELGERYFKQFNKPSVTIGAFRPFPLAELCDLLDGTARVVCVEKGLAPGLGGVLASNVRMALRGAPKPVYTVIAGLGGRPITRASLAEVFRRAAQDNLEDVTFLDLNWEVVHAQTRRAGATRESGPIAENLLKALNPGLVRRVAGERRTIDG